MVAYGKAMRPSLVDVMSEVNALDNRENYIFADIGYDPSEQPATCVVSQQYETLRGIQNNTLIVYDLNFEDTAIATLDPSHANYVEIRYQFTRYDDTTQAAVFDKVTVRVNSDNSAEATVDNDTFSGGSYTLPTASAETLGGVKVGSGLAIDNAGVLKNNYSYTLPKASATQLGGVKVGSGLAIDTAGVLKNNYSYTLPKASATQLGGVKVGSGLAINNAGVLSASGGGSYTLPVASAETLGGVKVGSGLAIDSAGVLSASGGSGGGSATPLIIEFTGTYQTAAPQQSFTYNLAELADALVNRNRDIWLYVNIADARIIPLNCIWNTAANVYSLTFLGVSFTNFITPSFTFLLTMLRVEFKIINNAAIVSQIFTWQKDKYFGLEERS